MIIEKFQNQVKQIPDTIALKHREQWLTYNQLDRYSEATAKQIVTQWPGTARKQTIGLLFNHGIEMIVAILAALKAGKAYVPLPADYPLNRLKYMLEHSQAEMILTHTPLKSIAESLRKNENFPVLDITHTTGNQEQSGETPVILPKNEATDQPAYIMYTSGSTGKPKGVVQTQENICYHVEPWATLFSIGPNQKMTLFSSFGHDASVMDIYGALLNGATLYPLNMRDSEDNSEISEFLKKEKITIWHSVPSLFNFFTNTLSGNEEFLHLQYIILGGEAVRKHEIQQFQDHFPYSTLASIYGQTESSVNAIWLVKPTETVDKFILGTPLSNTELFVVDDNGNEVNPLRTGEILVAGPHISLGYWQDEETTGNCFESDEEFGRLYWTGDMGRLLLDGNIEFIGRKDNQIKIRGYRIEAGEIETILLQQPKIKEAVVTAGIDEHGEHYLCAYIVNSIQQASPESSNDEPETPSLRETLAQQLPDYMIPSFFIPVPEIPKTTSGKIDRNALPKPEIKSSHSNQPPANQIEKTMVTLWEDILNIPPGKIGREDNFFERGGHSLRAAILVARIHKVFNTKITLTQIFKTPTVKGLSLMIKNRVKDQYKSIKATEKKEFYPLSPAQNRLYILQQMEKHTTVYNLTRIETLTGTIDIQQVENIFQLLKDRHEELRTSIHMINENPAQRIHSHIDLNIETLNHTTRKENPKKSEQTARQFINQICRPFDLAQAPLMRVGIIQAAPETVVLVVDIHHIITDGTSQRILLEEFKDLYERKKLPPLKIHYKDFAQWQNNKEQQTALHTQETYWLNEMKGEIPVLQLPYDKPRPAIQSFEGANLGNTLTQEETQRLQALALAEDTTLYMVLLTVLILLLSKLSDQEEILIGTAVAGRRHDDLQHMIGMFVNTLVIRSFIQDELPFNEFLAIVKDKVLKAFENQEYPFEELVDKIQLPKEAGRNPLFDVMFTLQNMAEFNNQSTGINKEEIPQEHHTTQNRYEKENQVAQFDITVTAATINQRLRINFNYCTQLFERETIQRWNTYYCTIINTLLENPYIKIAQIQLISNEERHQLLYEINETGTWTQNHRTICDLFIKQSEKTPDKIAVIGTGYRGQKSNQTLNKREERNLDNVPCTHILPHEIQLSYCNLNSETNQLANILRKNGVLPEMIVALKMERTIEMISGIIAILKAGGAYMPIDPGNPEERTHFMLTDSNAQIILTPEKLEALSKQSPKETIPNRLAYTPGQRLAYVIYTSGTTGKPKGTLTTHANVLRVVKDTNYISISENDRILQLSNYAFDGSVFDIFGAILNSATLVMIKKEDVISIDQLSTQINTKAITLFFLTTALFNTLVDMQFRCLKGIRKILFGGEAVSPMHVRKAFNFMGKDKIIHVYGPTETTVYATYYPVNQLNEQSGTVPIGRPISKTVIYILNRLLQIVPVGVTGEIFIGGDGVARGYLNRPELTAEKFCHLNPGGSFRENRPLPPRKKSVLLSDSPTHPLNHSTIYRTGDLARWQPQKQIQFLGRKDFQVKIRGYRIELSEIETLLLSYPEIDKAIVEARSDKSLDKYLCAYVEANREVNITELKAKLAEKLPDFMIPAYFIQLPQIPLNANGKVDRKALPEPVKTTTNTYTPPQTPVEKQVAELWKEVLGMNQPEREIKIGIEDDFFQLGGHSLKATILAAKIQKHFKIKIPLAEIFKSPTIKYIAQTITQSEKNQQESIHPIEKKEYYELSPAQKRLFILQQMETNQTGYNVTQTLHLPPHIEKQQLETVFEQLINRHESLRTSFHMVNQQPVQIIHPHVQFEIEEPQPQEQNRHSYLKEFIRPFDLTRAPLMRAAIVTDKNNKKQLLLDMHHIITDGTSQTHLAEETRLLFEENELPLLPIQYKDYAQWQNKQNQQIQIKNHEKYWKSLYPKSGTLPVLNMLTDLPRPSIHHYWGKTVEVLQNLESTQKIKQLAQQNNMTLFMTLLSAFYILLSKLTGQEDIIIGTPVAGRRHADLQNIIGMFVNTLAIRNQPQKVKTVNEFLQEVKANTLNAFENQEYPFEQLVEQLDLPRETGRNPLFDVMFNLLNQAEYTIEKPIPENDNNPTNNHTDSPAKFDITLTTVDLGQNLLYSFQYNSELFYPQTIDRLIIYFQELIDAIIYNPQRRISSIEIIPEQERRQIIDQFNRIEKTRYREMTVQEMILLQMERTPDNIALEGPSTQLDIKPNTQKQHYPQQTQKEVQITYRQLKNQCDRLGDTLYAQGMRPGTIAAVLINRSVEMITAICTILINGAIYLPIDPSYPQERIHFMLADSGAKILLTDQENVEEPVKSDKNKKDHNLSILNSQGNPFSENKLITSEKTGSNRQPNIISSENLIYIIYTSGTTGKPKGVPVLHRGMVNMIHVHREIFQETPISRISQVAGPGFDAMGFEIWPCLTVGAALVIADNPKKLDPVLMKQWLIKKQITISFQPTIIVERLLDETWPENGNTLKYLRTGGDKLTRYPEKNHPFRLFNIYGPTEDTVWSTHAEIQPEPKTNKLPSIGKPIRNHLVIILGPSEEMQPIGVPGELCVTGIGLAAGYLNRPELTLQKFCELQKRNPFYINKPHDILRETKISHSTTQPLNHSTIYTTGDMTRWEPDGNIEFLGRFDTQVKIRGNRIELGEIESLLLTHEKINKAVVTAMEINGEKYLCAYYVSATEIDTTEMRNYLSETLPGYMVPSYFNRLHQIPLTPNGKLDTKALPEPKHINSNEYTPPRNQLEKMLVKIWEEVLSKETLKEKQKIGIQDNFFELGGHSLKATTLISKMHKETDVLVPLVQLFKTPTIKEIALYIKSVRKDKYVSIEPVEQKEYYPLSSAQKRLQFIHQLKENDVTYNIPQFIPLTQKVDKEKLKSIFNTLIQRHESFRTSIHMVNETPVQRIHQQADAQIKEFKLTENNPENNLEIPPPTSQRTVEDSKIIKNPLRALVKSFDISRAPLLRVGLIKNKNNDQILMIDMHHIITDGTSHTILVNEFLQLNREQTLPPLRIQYKDYAQWQQSNSYKALIKEQEAYWLNEFTGEIPVLQIPLDNPRPREQSFAGNTLYFSLDSSKTKELKQLVHEMKMTLFIMILSTFNVLLSKLSNQQEIIVGTSQAGRRHENLEAVIGMFVNTLALKNYPYRERTFTDFLQEVKTRTLQAFENQEYPFEELIEKLPLQRDTSRNPLFDVMINLLSQLETKSISNHGMKMKRHRESVAKFDLTLTIVDMGEELQFSLDYCSKLFKPETIDRISQFFHTLLNTIIQNPHQPLGQLEIISQEEKHLILNEFNKTNTKYPQEKSIDDLLLRQIVLTPDLVALVSPETETEDTVNYNSEEVQVTYKELNHQAENHAHLLKEKGVNAESIVAILIKPCIRLIISIVGVIKSGGAYLPIEPGTPETRRELILKDSQAQVLVTPQHETVLNLSGSIHKNWTYNSTFTINSRPKATSLAYIIYTSGTTGKPKGVMIQHRSVVRLVKNNRELQMVPYDHLLLTGAVNFDATTYEIWGTLLNGATLHLKPKETIINPIQLKKILAHKQVTHMWMTAPLFNRMLQEDIEIFKYLRTLLVGGDILSPTHLKELKTKYPQLIAINGYGPTENTTFSTTHTIEPPINGSISIGKPISGSTAYVVDHNQLLQPIGVAGELVVGGDGISRGYLNNPELTAEKFYPTPQATNQPINQSTLYHTGDLARWQPQGTLEFLGRMDAQVKIRGHRIEPGEIENCLINQPEIKDAVVIARIPEEDSNKEKTLYAYLVLHTDQESTSTEWHQYLSTLLPEYMIPTFFIEVKKIPLTPNGKVDLKALPTEERKRGNKYKPPQDEIQSQLKEIWRDVLGGNQEHIGINDNFFSTGGQSLKAAALVSRIHKHFKVKIPLMEIFNNPTIAGQSQYIEKVIQNRYIPINPIEKKEFYPQSPAQQRLYIFQQMGGAHTGYNVPNLISLDEDCNRNHLETLFKTLITRHESLRTSFHMINQTPVQRIHETVDFSIESFSVNNSGSKSKNVREPLKSEPVAASFNSVIRPFDLSKAPLIRVVLFKTEACKTLLIIDMHHIITDGTSQTIIAEEIKQLTVNNTLHPVKLQYKDYSHWQNSIEQKQKLAIQKNYWLKCYSQSSVIPVLDLPTDNPRPLIQNFRGKGVDFSLLPNETTQIRQIAQNSDITLFMFFLAVFNIFLAKLSGQEEIIVGIPIAARQHIDLEKIVGMFVNTLPLKNSPQGEKTVKTLLKDVRKTTLEAFENQEYQFDQLVEELSLPRDTGRNPLFDVMFNFLNQAEDNQVHSNGTDTEQPLLHKHKERNSKFDLTLTAIDQRETIFFSLGYSTQLFKPETIDRYITYFKTIINEIIIDHEKWLKDLEILPEKERETLLYTFNSTKSNTTEKQTLWELFEESVTKHPDNIALVGTGKLQKKNRTHNPTNSHNHISYRELGEHARRLSHLLKAKGVGQETCVAIKMRRSEKMIMGILGIIMSKAAYIPINPNYPEKRIYTIMKDSNAHLLINEDIFSHLHIQQPVEKSKKIEIPPNEALSYIIYTSGSTGTPKGVMINQESVVNVVSWYAKTVDIRPGTRMILMSDYTFDPSVNQIFGTLLFGATLYIISKEVLLQAEVLRNYIQLNQIQIVHFVPTVLKEVLGKGEKLESVKVVLSGGERLEETFKNQILQKGYPLYNLYGPTEATIDTLAGQCTGQQVTLGRPIHNSQCYIIDQYFHLVPIGVTGELCIGGMGIARGYLNRPELTAEKFCPLQYKHVLKKSTKPLNHSTIYLTGDLTRWQPDGQIQFIGRKDNQVKIRGNRIELGEIENAILKFPGIDNAILMERDQQLCAYIQSSKDIDMEILRKSLTQILPEHMIPAYFIQIERVPLTPHGKIDRNVLPQPQAKYKHNYIAPRNRTEEEIRQLWSEILGNDPAHAAQLLSTIGIDDNFFTLGGHSLKATILVSKIKKEMNITIPLIEIFQKPTIRQLAKIIQQSTTNPKKLNITGDTQMVPLRYNNSNSRPLFFIHEGSGEVEGYLEFCQQVKLSEDYSCWGIRAELDPGTAPRNLSIETVAAKYIKKIRKMQPIGPYYILGWSVGGTIAFEIVRQLEQMQQPVEILVMFDTAPPPDHLPKTIPTFTRETEIQWLKRYLKKELLSPIEGMKNTQEIWEFIIQYFEANSISTEIIKNTIAPAQNLAVPNYQNLSTREFIRYINILRSFHNALQVYAPKVNINTPVHYFKASKTKAIKQEKWQKYIQKPVNYYRINGNHYSIFKSPIVKMLTDKFEEILLHHQGKNKEK